MNQTFSFKNVRASLVPTTDETLMNAARYQARLIKSRSASASGAELMADNMVEFSLILAHVIDTKGFPFSVPDPSAHPETVGLVWDAYKAEDSALWNQILTAIELASIQPPPALVQQIKDRLPDATAEMDAFSAHHTSPFIHPGTSKRKVR